VEEVIFFSVGAAMFLMALEIGNVLTGRWLGHFASTML
jgi:hypothetical protein